MLKEAGVNVLISAALPKFAAMAIRRISDLNWHPMHFMTNVSVSITAVMVHQDLSEDLGLLALLL